MKTLLKKVLTSKALLIPVAMVAIVAGAAGFTAFEAHVINVTAKIENALAVTTDPIDFGTVFPEETFDAPITVSLSGSFLAEDRVDDVDYVIKQKPKCQNSLGKFGRVTELDDVFVCEDGPGFSKLPELCPFLSKEPLDQDGNDTGVAAFHGPVSGWTPEDTDNLENQGKGKLTKAGDDITDDWNIDFKVPCFAGSCAQDNFVPEGYELDPLLESALFGCDLWVEVTHISLD